MDGNTIIEGDSNLSKHATDYYKNLFGPATGNTFPLNEDLWEVIEKVTREDNIELTQPFSESEINEAFFRMERNNTAGPDKIPIEFYQHWK